MFFPISYIASILTAKQVYRHNKQCTLFAVHLMLNIGSRLVAKPGIDFLTWYIELFDFSLFFGLSALINSKEFI